MALLCLVRDVRGQQCGLFVCNIGDRIAHRFLSCSLFGSVFGAYPSLLPKLFASLMSFLIGNGRFMRILRLDRRLADPVVCCGRHVCIFTLPFFIVLTKVFRCAASGSDHLHISEFQIAPLLYHR